MENQWHRKENKKVGGGVEKLGHDKTTKNMKPDTSWETLHSNSRVRIGQKTRNPPPASSVQLNCSFPLFRISGPKPQSSHLVSDTDTKLWQISGWGSQIRTFLSRLCGCLCSHDDMTKVNEFIKIERIIKYCVQLPQFFKESTSNKRSRSKKATRF